METGIVAKDQKMEEIEADLALLSNHLISLLKDCKEKGYIDESQYQKEVKVKEAYLDYFNRKKSED